MFEFLYAVVVGGAIMFGISFIFIYMVLYTVNAIGWCIEFLLKLCEKKAR